MSNYGSLLLSKVVDNNEAMALERHNITERHFQSATDKKAFKFIREYAQTNRGRAPSYAALVEEVPEFSYIPSVEDGYEYLTRRLFHETAEEELANFINGEIDPKELRKNPDATLALMFENYADDMPTLLTKLKEKLEDIEVRTTVRGKIGIDVKKDVDKFKEEYEKREAGLSHKTWKSRYASIGKYTSGNLYVVYGKSGRGKSVTTLADLIHMAQQGARCLLWGMEMSWFEIFVRIYSILSGDAGIRKINVAGVDLEGGFDTSDIREGELAEEFKTQFFDFITALNQELAGELTVRAVDDDDFNDRSLRALEQDILDLEADVVVVDPFYYLDYEKNEDKTTGGAASTTSQRLRKLTGRLKVVMIAITQADEGNELVDEDGSRELSLPSREDVKKTKSLLEDAYILIAIDTDYKQGRGLISNNKGRDGGEGDVTEIMYMPQYGICRSLMSDELSIDDFAGF